jgi:hypothetical protein
LIWKTRQPLKKGESGCTREVRIALVTMARTSLERFDFSQSVSPRSANIPTFGPKGLAAGDNFLSWIAVEKR